MAKGNPLLNQKLRSFELVVLQNKIYIIPRNKNNSFLGFRIVETGVLLISLVGAAYNKFWNKVLLV